jgi:AGCS family alanine or glycine:cation symporter
VDAGRIATGGNLSGVALTSLAFSKSLSWFPYVLALAVTLFAFSTMVSWSYYGVKAWTYLFGESSRSETTFNSIFCVFVVIGSAMNLGAVIDFADASIFAMALVNITGLYILMPVVKREMTSYWDRLQRGEIRKTKA